MKRISFKTKPFVKRNFLNTNKYIYLSIYLSRQEKYHEKYHVTTKFQKFCAEIFTIESATHNVSKMPSFIKIYPRWPKISSKFIFTSFLFLFNIIFSQSYAFFDTKLKISSVSVDGFWWMMAFWKRYELHFP